jgi:hypothetical protein
MWWLVEIAGCFLADVLGFLAFEKPDRYEFAGRIVLWIMYLLAGLLAMCLLGWLFGGSLLSAFQS